MRVICEDFAIGIEWVRRNGKRLIFKAVDGSYYCTDDYFAENIAYCRLSDLVMDGYLKVKVLNKM
jgi:hypothetical protein